MVEDWDLNPTNTKEEQQDDTKDDISFDLQKIKQKFMKGDQLQEKLTTLLYGKDGTFKSGLALSYLTDQDISDGKRALIIDLDGGNSSLILNYHKERCEKLGRDVNDVFLLKNPLQMDDEGNIDYKGTYKEMKEGIYLARNAYEDLNLKFMVIDGLSTALSYSEQQMRIEKNINPDGGVNMQYWKIRNKRFLDLIEQARSTPISTIFIGHEDFILSNDGDDSSVKKKTSALMHQKILMEREDDNLEGKVTFKATIHKSKNNIKIEGKQYNLLILKKDTGEYELTTTNLFEELE